MEEFLSATFGDNPSTTFAASSSVIPVKTSIGTWAQEIMNYLQPKSDFDKKIQQQKQDISVQNIELPLQSILDVSQQDLQY